MPMEMNRRWSATGKKPACLQYIESVAIQGLRVYLMVRDRSGSRVSREKKTVKAMIEMYCHDNHGGAALCADCQELADYTLRKIDKCPLLPKKPTCLNCKIHCYEKDRRESIRIVMRHSGPRMLLRHPWLAVTHIVDGRRKPR
jgi:hypothetical protein